jgi:hypothetical protein
VQSELNGLKGQRAWTSTAGCSDITGKSNREFCQQFHKLTAEHASALEAQKLETRIAEIGARLATTAGGTALAEADPQASVLAKLSGLNVEMVQTALTLFVALLIEIGSGFGMYVAFAHWRLHETPETRAAAPCSPQLPRASARRKSREPSSPLRSPRPARRRCTRRLHRAQVRRQRQQDRRQAAAARQRRRALLSRARCGLGGSSLTSQDLYESYCAWCEERDKEPFAMPTFSGSSNPSVFARNASAVARATSISR